MNLPRDTKSGLEEALKVLGKIDDIGFCQLSSKDVVRHPLVQKIVKAYDDYEEKKLRNTKNKKGKVMVKKTENGTRRK